ncbi:MAG: metal-dependent transcriptional regulator [Acidobacteriota bacterium]
MPTSTVEDYLKAILLAEEKQTTSGLVSMGQIAAALDVAPGTVTAMVKTLEKDGLLTYEPYNGVRLSKAGRRAALHVLRRHRLIELFLVETLGFDWSEVHEEAEQLEHAMSEKLIGRIDVLLGFPSVDPHGDPIPDDSGKFRDAELISLVDCPPGEDFRIARVSDQEEAFLRFLEKHGLKPGSQIAVHRQDPSADAFTIQPHQLPQITIGGEAAAKLWVEPLGAAGDDEK